MDTSNPPTPSSPGDGRYIRLLKRVYASAKKARFLSILSQAAVMLTVLCYGCLMYFGFAESTVRGFTVLALTALPFGVLSIIRRLLPSRRPYELYDFPSLGIPVPKDKKGSSFPSRHVFSAFIIGGILIPFSPILGGVTLALGIGIALCRVLLGIHFLRDVVAGAIAGAFAAIIADLILFL